MEDELLSLGDFIDKAIVKCLKEYDRKKESLADSEGISPLAVASHSVSSSAFPQHLAHHKLTDGQKVCHSKGKESLQAPTMSARKYQNMGRSTVTEPEWHHVQSVLDGADLVVVGCSGVSTVQASSAVDKEQDLHEHVIGCELDSSELGQLDSETLQPKLHKQSEYKVGNITGGSCHKYHFCHDKRVFVLTKHVFCHDKRILAVTNFCHKIMSATTQIFL